MTDIFSQKYQPRVLTDAQVLYKAKLAQQMERFDEMTSVVRLLFERGVPFTTVECGLLNVAYTEALRERRQQWRGLAEVEEKEDEGGRRRELHVDMVCSYRRHVEAEIHLLCSEVWSMAPRILDPEMPWTDEGSAVGRPGSVETEFSAVAGGGGSGGGGSGRGRRRGSRHSGEDSEDSDGAREGRLGSDEDDYDGADEGKSSVPKGRGLTKNKEGVERAMADEKAKACAARRSAAAALSPADRALCIALQADCHRYMAETQTGDDRRKSAELAQSLYLQAQEEVKVLEPTHPRRLGVALNFAVFLAEVNKNLERACRLARQHFDAAAALHQSLDPRAAKACFAVMKHLQDNLLSWSTDEDS